MVEFVSSGSRHGGGAFLVGNLADRAAVVPGRAGQSDQRRVRAGVAPPKRAPRAPFGRQEWQEPIAKRLGVGSAYRPSGRTPKKGRFEYGPKTGLKAHHETNRTRSVRFSVPRSLVSSGVLTQNPFDAPHPNVHVSPGAIKECEARFPLLSVTAKLAHTDEKPSLETLRYFF